MRHHSLRDSALAATGLALAGLGAGAYAWLMRPLAYWGHICGHGPAELHCPACYVALAAVAAGLAMALAPAARLQPLRR